MGLFITFEGIEGSGKSTQMALLAADLEKRGIHCRATSEPGGSELGRELRRLLLQGIALDITARSELLLFAADRAQHVERVILPALQDGAIVLCDRFSDATMAYQGCGRGLARDDVAMINDFAAGSLKPHYTLLFDMPPEQGLARVRRRAVDAGIRGDSHDRFEEEHLEFHRRVREGYLALAAKEPDRFRIIDAGGNVDTVFRNVKDAVSVMLE
ncbi:MAG: dTMP kinase [Syntrophales bacterium]|jgi:dTMP kinase|nr:dTMP kinase [Syntrophales bacterium]MCK9527697.1 dTMP kinase [Syntrophales bacterium]MDX9921648.1 dTMP kinase [Syntrophales bacterium]